MKSVRLQRPPTVKPLVMWFFQEAALSNGRIFPLAYNMSRLYWAFDERSAIAVTAATAATRHGDVSKQINYCDLRCCFYSILV